MGSKSNSFKNAFLLLLFNNTNIANIGDATGLRGASAAGNVYVRLCTSATVVNDATLGVECNYTGYVAGGVAVPRTSLGWTISGNSAFNAALITFGACTLGANTVRYFEIWKDNTSSVESARLFWGQLDSDLEVVTEIVPEFWVGDLVINED